MSSIPKKSGAESSSTVGNLLPVRQGESVLIWINGKAVQAFKGEMVSTALMSNGIRQFRHTRKPHAPRGLYCGMGICFDCLVTVDGVLNVRACMTPVKAGMRIETESS